MPPNQIVHDSTASWHRGEVNEGLTHVQRGRCRCKPWSLGGAVEVMQLDQRSTLSFQLFTCHRSKITMDADEALARQLQVET